MKKGDKKRGGREEQTILSRIIKGTKVCDSHAGKAHGLITKTPFRTLRVL